MPAGPAPTESASSTPGRGRLRLGPVGVSLPLLAAHVGLLLVFDLAHHLTLTLTLLGAAFLGLEMREFADMIARGATPQRSAFLSAFFTLVGCHGLHVTAGLIWLAVMMAQVAFKGFRPTVQRRLLCFSLFWHALDIIWVGLFTVIYLMGVVP